MRFIRARFQDANDDGVGNLAAFLRGLDYLLELGKSSVDCPIFVSDGDSAMTFATIAVSIQGWHPGRL